MEARQLTPIQESGLLFFYILDFSRLPWPRIRKAPAKYKLPVYLTSHPSGQTDIAGPRSSEIRLIKRKEKRRLPLCVCSCNSSESLA